MADKGSYVHYGSSGVCQVEGRKPMRFELGTPCREYYVLRPVGQESASIFVPADNPALTGRMRPVLSREEIDRLLAQVGGQRLLWTEDRNQRMDTFRDILRSGDEGELLLLIRCLLEKSRERTNGLPSMDAQVLKKAEAMIAQSFAFSLGIREDQVGDYIRKTLGLEAQAVVPPSKTNRRKTQ